MVRLLGLESRRANVPGFLAEKVGGRHPIGVESLTRAEIYRKHASELLRFATSLVGPADAADVVSEAVVKSMWSKAWASVSNRRAYLYQAVLNESRMHHRGTMRRRSYEMKAAPPDSIWCERDSGLCKRRCG